MLRFRASKDNRGCLPRLRGHKIMIAPAQRNRDDSTIVAMVINMATIIAALPPMPVVMMVLLLPLIMMAVVASVAAVAAVVVVPGGDQFCIAKRWIEPGITD